MDARQQEGVDDDTLEDRQAQTPAWVLLQQTLAEVARPPLCSFSSPVGTVDVTDAHFGAMFEQFVSSVRIGKQGDLACVSLTLDLGGTAPVHVMIEETSMGPTIELQSDNPVEAFALKRALERR